MSAVPIEDMTLLSETKDHVVVFEQVFAKDPKICNEDPPVVENFEPDRFDVIVFVHGYQGSSADMRMFRNMLMKPFTLMLMSTVNEERTEGAIAHMGIRLANEIAAFIRINISSRLRRCLGRVSFICHSLGGLIVRAALMSPMLDDLTPHYFTFFSLGCPHLGYVHGANFVFETGLWLMRKFYKSTCLTQLSMADDLVDVEKCYLFELSRRKGLQYFKNVILVASQQDQYVPHHSARIETTPAETKWGQIHNRMAMNLLEQLGNVNLIRFDISFVGAKKPNFDNLIGRAAHIYFLDQPLYIQMLTHVYREYFIRQN
jgi:hypothetical protein